MIFKGIEIVCPHCQGELDRAGEEQIGCRSCNRRFPVLLGIPDLRVHDDPYAPLDAERAKARRIAERYDDFDFDGLIDFYYSISPDVPAHHAALYKRSLLAGVPRARAWLDAWENAAAAPPGGANAGHLLDIGCGTGPLLAAADRYPVRAGIDVALRWMVVGKKRLEEAELDLPYICANAEALPFPPGSFDRTVFDSVLEHLPEQERSLDQARIVLRPGGHAFFSTPNRFSLGPDPHTGIWAGSLLPDRWTAAIVKRQGGRPPKRRLHGAGGLRRLLRDAGFTGTRIYLPGIAAGQRALFSPAMGAVIQAYDLARRLPLSRNLLRLIGPLLHAVTQRPAERG